MSITRWTGSLRRSALLASAAVLALTLAAVPAFAGGEAGTDGDDGSTLSVSIDGNTAAPRTPNSADDGSDGTGGAGILANGTITITNNGTISGGYDSDGTTVTGYAIDVETGTTTLDSASGSTLTGDGALEIDSDGHTVTLSGDNSFTGGVTLTSGTVAITSATSLGDTSSTLTLSGDTLKVRNDIDLTWPNTVNVTTGTSSTIDFTSGGNYSSTVTISSTITGTGGLTVTGKGEIDLNGGTSSTLLSLAVEYGAIVYLGSNTSTSAGTISVSSNGNGYSELFLKDGATLVATSGVTVGSFGVLSSYGDATITGDVTVEDHALFSAIFEDLSDFSSGHTLSITGNLNSGKRKHPAGLRGRHDQSADQRHRLDVFSDLGYGHCLAVWYGHARDLPRRRHPDRKRLRERDLAGLHHPDRNGWIYRNVRRYLLDLREPLRLPRSFARLLQLQLRRAQRVAQ
ncbi:hypothetical protein [Breoghania sp.]|uniref:hypothetical protein n=1 Tax=Breoghania sp. TaxID=2065378 RepID=UPI0026161014|nr:hypothetical protein [Breoghania sp.]MDJ0931451.1 hypothetical protein [Breoghania sp.]